MEKLRSNMDFRHETAENDARRPFLHQYYDVPRKQEGTSFVRASINSLNALSGVGIVSIPYAVSKGGWLSLLLLVMVAVICCYTGMLLQRCMSTAPDVIRSYPDIGERGFGSKGRAAVSFAMCLELYLVAIDFLILEGDTLNKLFPNASLFRLKGQTLFIVLSALVILPSTWSTNLGFLAYVSAGGVLASVIVPVSVLYVGAFHGTGFHKTGTTVLLNVTGLPTALGLYSFCYCGHAVFPTIYTSMRNKAQFSAVLLLCFLLCTVNYGSMAVLGYLMYGEDLKSQITLNLPAGNIGTTVAVYTTLINPFTKFALMINPLTDAIEDQLSVRKISTRVLVRTVVIGSAVAIAIGIPFFAYIMAFIGSFLGVLVSILLPCLCFLRISGTFLTSHTEIAFIIGIFAVGILVSVVGTYSSIMQILSEL